MTLRQQYNALTVLLLTWKPHEPLLYDCICNTRKELRSLIQQAQASNWDDSPSQNTEA